MRSLPATSCPTRIRLAKLSARRRRQVEILEGADALGAGQRRQPHARSASAISTADASPSQTSRGSRSERLERHDQHARRAAAALRDGRRRGAARAVERPETTAGARAPSSAGARRSDHGRLAAGASPGCQVDDHARRPGRRWPGTRSSVTVGRRCRGRPADARDEAGVEAAQRRGRPARAPGRRPTADLDARRPAPQPEPDAVPG